MQLIARPGGTMKKGIGEKSIRSLEAPEAGNRIEWDEKFPGFGVRITASGATSFIIDYYVSGRRRRYTIGRHPGMTASVARARAEALRVRIRDGFDPLAERVQARTEPTVEELAAEYLERCVVPNKRPTSVRNDRQMITGIIIPHIGKLRLKAVGKRDIELLHQSLKATRYRANRVLALLSTMFNYALARKWLGENPARGIEKFPEEKREFWLTVDQIQKFREALDSYSDQNAANALRLLLFTGSREGEVLKAEWEQFDLLRGVWTKPSHNTKQKKVEHVPLSAGILELLQTMKPQASGPLFPGVRGGARTTLRRPWVQACKAVGLVTTKEVEGKRGPITKYRPTVRIHDLRHSFASHLVSNGVSLQIVGKLLGHTQASTTMRYAHLQDEALRAASNQLSEIYTESKSENSGA
jgi:integrase